MNSGTFYLYEYENNKRRRNVGFIKVARHYRSCILQIHAHGVPVSNGASLELYAFYRDGADLIADQIAVLNCFRRNISARLPVSESHFPEGRPLPQIDGFFIRLPEDRTTLFWMASAFFFDVDMNRLIIASSKSACPDSTDSADVPLSTNVPRTEEKLPSTDIPLPEEALPSADIPQPEETSAPADILAAEERSKEQAPSPVPPALSSQDKQPSARKIQRSDIAQLPRRFWPLANNSFLLHGYHNYNHLMLIEEDGRTWLGVPGIYAPQEARAADLFGFPRFTRSCASFPELTDEERSDSDDFGHWCRCVGTSAQIIPFIS